MSVCACGQLMDVGDGWCKKCWANWSVWFMRAEGKWMSLAHGFYLTSGRCSCNACGIMRAAIMQADYAERRMTQRR